MNGEWLNEYLCSEMVAIPNQEMQKHRTISLVTHTSKILLRVMNRRQPNSWKRSSMVPGKGKYTHNFRYEEGIQLDILGENL